LGDRKGIRSVKRWVLVCWWWWLDCIIAHLIAPVVNTTSIILVPIKSRRETFWYQLTQVVRENLNKSWNELSEEFRERTKHLDIFLFSRPSLNGVLFLMFYLLVEGECQILVKY